MAAATAPPVWDAPPDRTPMPVVPDDPDTLRYMGELIGLMRYAAATEARSVQPELGSSEAGSPCDRQVLYTLTGTPRVNQRDPLRTMIGSGLHLLLANFYGRLSVYSGRFLVETEVVFGGILGHVDLYDRLTGTVVDFKTTTKDKISHLKSQGPSPNYSTQVMLYGGGLEAAGHEVRMVALLFIPIDGELSDAWMWRHRYDRAVAEAAVSRVDSLRSLDPAMVKATPSRLCPWCNHYQPGSKDLAVACPGGAK